MRALYCFTCAALLAFGTRTLAAQSGAQPAPAATRPARNVTPTFGLTVGTMSIDSGSAARSQVGDRSYGLQLDMGVVVKRHFIFALDLGGQFLDDHAQFSQNTTGGVMKSSASITYLSAMTGVRSGTLRAVPLALGLNLGASKSIGRRSIDNCSDCQVDKLDIAGGAFVEPTVLLGLGRRNVQLRVSDRVFLSGDGMRSVISAGAELGLRSMR